MVKNVKTCKIALVGSGAAGKTTLVRAFTRGSSFSSSLPSISMTKGIDIEVGYVSVGDTVYALQIWDFGGQTQFRFILHLLLKGAEGVIYVYDTTDYETLSELYSFVETVRSITGDDPLSEVVVGTKSDLLAEVNFKDVHNFLSSTGVSLHFTTSGLKGINVEKPFLALAKLIHARHTAKVTLSR